ncbi:YceI family protein [Leptospira sp. 2 VSF19]|uniref:YceI family protein n=1 Tax=Leptospira soteropolitanensis TaxID=2950025 RepID=A0AAW5V8R1_9LEPT|nr:YceI family protein [Leptospira soteropolitanensis]MCW7491759.1 YceI family protein [Leptospira soteropolitanensis]MCW7499344.1 YceI family protein [Leptospira soteropolitanensis]MCW7521065.1 YceI family protein [Leptospira soteropolitanensis]MCW7525447.1 YceI family protein [Leptospira soteropolitanensis]MCW7529314.1 YceI family protein [Leptospira soteropolitanensis]
MKKKIVCLAVLFFGANIFAAEVTKKNIEFFVEHTTKNVTGVCNEIQMDPPNIQVSGNHYILKSPFGIKIPVLKIVSGDANRDSHIQEILGYPDSPNILVKIESVEPGNEQTYRIKGKLTIHGNTKGFSTDATVSLVNPNSIQVNGSLVVKFSEYELENPSLLFMKAKDEIRVKYHFEIQLK